MKSLLGSSSLDRLEKVKDIYKSCPICNNSDYIITTGCDKCGYKNRWVYLVSSASNKEFRDLLIDKMISRELDNSRDKIISKFLEHRKQERKSHPCPKCTNVNYLIFDGCSSCGYKNRWAYKVIVAMANGSGYVPIDMMYLDEMMTRDFFLDKPS